MKFLIFFRSKARTDTVIGDEVLKLPPGASSEYNVHFPFKRGDINLHPGIGTFSTLFTSVAFQMTFDLASRWWDDLDIGGFAGPESARWAIP